MGPEQLGMVVGGVLAAILVIFRSRAAAVFVSVCVLVLVGAGVIASLRSGPTHEELEAAFLKGCGKGCAKTGASADVCAMRCDCVVHKLQEHRNPDEFSAFIHDAGTHMTPQMRSEMERTAMACQ